MQLEIMCTRKQVRLDKLVRSRKSPYLCKVDREGDFSLEVEMITACGYLEDGGVACTLHGRKRSDGRSVAIPLRLAAEEQGLHPLRFGPKRRRRASPRLPGLRRDSDAGRCAAAGWTSPNRLWELSAPPRGC
jgi:hypothetical protein